MKKIKFFPDPHVEVRVIVTDEMIVAGMKLKYTVRKCVNWKRFTGKCWRRIMNRLTQKDEQGNWSLKAVPWEIMYEGQVITKELWERLYGALWKLMEYEDTGLSPEEVEDINDFNKSQVGHLLKKLSEEQRKHRWIPV